MTIYFVGIGGAGLSPMAQLALDCGYKVTGSDKTPSLGTQAVEQREIYVDYLQDTTYLRSVHESATPVDWVVYTAACPLDHPELLYARQAGIRVSKRDEFINHVATSKQLKIIGVSGTDGKTTTSAMLNWVLTQMGIAHAHLVGSTLTFGPSARYQEGAEYMVIEADEFDRNFLHFHPQHSVVTNIHHDHSEIYASQTDYLQAFAQYIHQNNGEVWLWGEDWRQLRPYLKSESCVPLDRANERILEEIESINLLGFHNRCNAYLALQLLRKLFKLETTVIRKHLETFPGVQRRMEEITENLWSDYAHLPPEVKASLQMAREINPNVVVIYQPHQNRRQHEILYTLGGYGDCFDTAHAVYWLPTYLARETSNLAILSPEDIIRTIPKNTHIRSAGSVLDLVGEIQKHRNKGRLVVAMGAGSIDGAVRQVAAELAASVPLVA